MHKKLLLLFVVGLAISAGGSTRDFVLPQCLQDQYGNQYQNLVQDNVHHIVTGVVYPGQQGCGVSGDWTMVGSWVPKDKFTVLEITVANNTLPTSCVPIYKLKGRYPSANWFYVDGFQQSQPFSYTTCSANSPVVPDAGVGGAHGLK